MHHLCLVCLCFFPGVFLSSRVTGACPVTTDSIMGVKLRTTTNSTTCHTHTTSSSGSLPTETRNEERNNGRCCGVAICFAFQTAFVRNGIIRYALYHNIYILKCVLYTTYDTLLVFGQFCFGGEGYSHRRTRQSPHSYPFYFLLPSLTPHPA